MQTDEQAQKMAALQRRTHAADIRKQVKKKEDEMISARRKYFEEGIKLDQEAKERYVGHDHNQQLCLTLNHSGGY